MNYIYEKLQKNYEDYSSGRVLYNMPGAAPFPVRLASEIFERCKAVLWDNGSTGPYIVYDPLCGSGYLLTVLGFLHNKNIDRIIATDVDEKMLELAQRNLGLLTLDGLNRRIYQIEHMIAEYGKTSHKDALESALKLKGIIEQREKDIYFECYCADAVKPVAITGCLGKVDIVIADLPYGNITQWSCSTEAVNPAELFIDVLYDSLPPCSVVAVISDKKQKIRHCLFKRIEHFNVGKRLVTILFKEGIKK